MSDFHDEIDRLRERMEKAEVKLRDVVYSQRILGRLQGEQAGELDRLRDQIGEMSRSEEIAEAVSVRARADRRRRFSLLQKVAGVVVAGFALVPSATVVASWFGAG